MNDYEHLDTLLSNADWYYMRADDDRAFKRGLSAMSKLIEMKLALPDIDRAERIWSKHYPFTNTKTK